MRHIVFDIKVEWSSPTEECDVFKAVSELLSEATVINSL